MKLHAKVSSGDGTREASKSSNGNLHVMLYLGNMLAYHLKMNEHGQLVAYEIHDTDTPEVYTFSLAWSEYQAMNRKKR